MTEGDAFLPFQRAKFRTKLPRGRRYTAGHMWLRRMEDDLWQVGLTRFAVRMLRWVQVSPAGDRVLYEALGKLWIRELPDGSPRRLTSQAALWGSVVTLSPGFFSAVTERPVPVDFRALKALRSPLALDIYCWLTYRMSYLERPSKPIRPRVA